MKSARLAIFLVTISWITADLAHAESKWSFKNLIPSFGNEEAPPRESIAERKEPSVWSKMNRGTKAFFAKTKESIPPWLMPQTQERVRQSGQSLRSSSDRMREEAKVARRNFFAPWLQPDEPKKPESVSEWLGQDRPE